MIWALVACAAIACVYTGAQAQPTSCQSDDQCQTDFYCDRDVAYTCRRCLDCDQLKREPPPVSSQCIKSVTKCGPCIAGLVGDVNLDCVSPDARSDDAAIPAYVWVIISIGLLLFALVVVIVIYVLRNTYTFKILASTRASVQSPCSVGTGVGAGAGVGAASAPELPPPYNAHYSAVRPSSPPPQSPEPVHSEDAPHNGEESSWPFIKRTPSGYDERYSGGARESAGSQAARVFSNPHYVRGPLLPPSYDAAGVMGLSAGENAGAATSDDERDTFAHDEDTMESTWTPTAGEDHNGNVSGGAVGELSSQLDAARSTALIRAPHAHPPCGWQDSNNNRNTSETFGAAEGGAGAGSSSAPAFIINVVQTINTQQAPPHRHDPAC